MSLFGTQSDQRFVANIGTIAEALGDIAKELKAKNEAEYSEACKMSDETFKEILSSYPAEDLYELLNFDQKRYLEDKIKFLNISQDVRVLLEENEKYEDVEEKISDVEKHIVYPVANYIVNKGEDQNIPHSAWIEGAVDMAINGELKNWEA